MHKKTLIVALILLVTMSGCSSDRSILACEYFGTNSSENISEIENRTELSDYSTFTSYRNLEQKNKEIFEQALEEKTDLSQEAIEGSAKSYNNTVLTNHTEMKDFFPTPGRFGIRYIFYEGDFYRCGNVEDTGA